MRFMALGAIQLVRTHKGGKGSRAEAYAKHTKGGSLTHVSTYEKFSLFARTLWRRMEGEYNSQGG